MPASPPAAAPPPFTDQIRRRTRAAHKLSDVLIVSKLAVVLTDQRMYGCALGFFYPIYCAIERIIDQHASLPQLAPLAAVVTGQLRRRQALEADLAHYLGSEWQAKITTTAAVDRWAPLPAAP
jgi:heme oxygenase